MILVRATVNLPNARAGWKGLVDPDDPFVARMIRGGFFEQVSEVVLVHPRMAVEVEADEPGFDGAA